MDDFETSKNTIEENEEEQPEESWLERNKNKLLVGTGIAVAALAATYIGVRNFDTIKELIGSANDAVASLPNKTKLLDVTEIKDITPPIKSLQAVENVTPSMIEEAAKESIKRCPHPTSMHIRNLPTGWTPSPEKLAAAADLNIELGEGQTWVKAYQTGKELVS